MDKFYDTNAPGIRINDRNKMIYNARTDHTTLQASAYDKYQAYERYGKQSLGVQLLRQ